LEPCFPGVMPRPPEGVTSHRSAPNLLVSQKAFRRLNSALVSKASGSMLADVSKAAAAPPNSLSLSLAFPMDTTLVTRQLDACTLPPSLGLAVACECRARGDMQRAMSEADGNVGTLYFKRDHDNQMNARAMMVGPTKALVKLCTAAETVEQEVRKMRESVKNEVAGMVEGLNALVAEIREEHETTYKTAVAALEAELRDVRHDADQAVTALEETLRRERATAKSAAGTAAADLAASDAKHRALSSTIEQLKASHASQVAKSETESAAALAAFRVESAARAEELRARCASSLPSEGQTSHMHTWVLRA